ncbi:uncharacterized protein PHACADRAFT_185644 [Phanerochaete carnosa HHB-10118-sp]|uniref:DUF6593 domain-containing protein n=1 Tax=Phanerochaete carnosa (strain HHB-10118-sp) TaxID=650164 RepID=K5WWC9_PHACS|nr:uncharacterized protein PHACADRAFT_185644 [Phanerochaete carnosa HHB-10118-sp]EKM54772.1 hypothetical protein PHACADRAFT_185644 [Phanerochaete carnosa HHB-10118-sp]
MSTVKGLDIFFEDTTGDIAHSDFVDYYNRMSFQVRLQQRQSDRVTYAVCDTMTTAGRLAFGPTLSTLVFGANNALGTVQYHHKQEVSMEQYLSRVSGSLCRKFKGSDGRVYTWTFVSTSECEEWACTANGAEVAAYDTENQATRNPQDSNRRGSGKQLWISENFQQLAGELIITLIIMRHIRKYGL